MQVSRRFLNSDGSFAGVVVASLNPHHLTKFYDKIDLGSPGVDLADRQTTASFVRAAARRTALRSART